LIGAGVRDSCVKAGPRDPTGAKRAEGGPPAESECPERKSTFRFTLPQKNVENIEFIYSMKPL
jgi:hypothetical protein